MKEFFKSNAFKCIACLLSIALICSGLLAILNSVLAVSADDRTMRAIKKIYGEEKNYTTILDVDNNGDAIEYETGIIQKVFSIDNSNGSKDYLIMSTGKNGYKNGTITLWVQLKTNQGIATIEKTILENYDKQTLMSKLSNFYSVFKFKENYYSTTGNDGTEKAVVSGATKSSVATDNAINCVIKYAMEELELNEN